MADDDLDLEDEQDPQEEGKAEAAPEPRSQSPDYWKRRAEKAERKAQRTEAYLSLSQKFPGVTFDDLKGVDVREWERIASRLAAATTKPEASEPETPKEPSVPKEVADATKAFVATAGGTGPAAPPNMMTFEEAQRLGGPTNPQVREAIRKGLVEGVKPPPRRED